MAIMLFVFLFGRIVSASAQTGNSAAVPEELESLQATVKTFFENISDPAGGVQKGLEELLKSSPISGEDKEKTITALSNNIKEIGRRFGPYLSFEPIGVRMIGHDLVVLRYLYKCRDYPVVWYFTFYRPSAGSGDVSSRSWLLIHFYYDSNLNIASWEN